MSEEVSIYSMDLYALMQHVEDMADKLERVSGARPTEVRINPDDAREVVRNTSNLMFFDWAHGQSPDDPRIAGLRLIEDNDCLRGTVTVGASLEIKKERGA